MDMITRTHRYADKAQKVAFNPVGQVVGMMHESRSVRATIQGLVEEYLGAVERLQGLMPADAR